MKSVISILAFAFIFLCCIHPPKDPGVLVYRAVFSEKCTTYLYLYKNGMYIEEDNHCGYGKPGVEAGTWKAGKNKIRFSPGRYDSIFFKSIDMVRYDTGTKDHKNMPPSCSVVNIYSNEGLNVTHNIPLLYQEEGSKTMLPINVNSDSMAMLCNGKPGMVVFDELRSSSGDKLKIPVKWPFALNIRLSIPARFTNAELKASGPGMDYDLVKVGELLTDDGPGTLVFRPVKNKPGAIDELKEYRKRIANSEPGYEIADSAIKL